MNESHATLRICLFSTNPLFGLLCEFVNFLPTHYLGYYANLSFSIFNKPLETSVAISSSDSGEAATSSAKAEIIPSTLSESSPTQLLNFSMSVSTLDTKLGSVILFFKCSPCIPSSCNFELMPPKYPCGFWGCCLIHSLLVLYTNPSFPIFLDKPLAISIAISTFDSGEAATSSAKAEVVPSTLPESSPTELLNLSTRSVTILFNCSPCTPPSCNATIKLDITEAENTFMDSGDAATSSAKAAVSTLSESSPTELLNFLSSLATFDLKVGSVIILLNCSPKSDITSSGDAASSSFCPTTNWIESNNANENTTKETFAMFFYFLKRLSKKGSFTGLVLNSHTPLTAKVCNFS
ncbi:hypothetical protein CXB51_001981 [Gossypium anomalum]|uniref:Uncharacterized protein n=1 Tax=Gossypium anomalum TaxID=47600 RepID=A0A8J5Z3L1_9ROSI|nr:hypothetical protein CXB51_001981 [Gossypium anomalum]